MTTRTAPPRNKVLSVRLTEEEYSELEVIAAESRMAVSSWVRRIALMNKRLMNGRERTVPVRDLVPGLFDRGAQ